jgi:two-component system response regulator RegA
MVEAANLKKLSDFDNKSLLIVDDDNPFRDRLARAMEKRDLRFFKLRVYKKEYCLLKKKNQLLQLST